MAASMAVSTSVGLSNSFRSNDFSYLSTHRQSTRLVASALPNLQGLSSQTDGLSLKLDAKSRHPISSSHGTIVASKENPSIAPAVMTPAGPLDLSSILFRNRIIFIGQPINGQVAARIISQLVTLATIDEDADIMVYINTPGGNTYSVLAIYDCMSWETGGAAVQDIRPRFYIHGEPLNQPNSYMIKPKVGTVCFGLVGNQAALLLAGGEKGMRYSMPNARIMVNQPNAAIEGHPTIVASQINEALYCRHKLEKMFAALTGQSLETIELYFASNYYFSATEAMDFGLIDGLLETEY